MIVTITGLPGSGKSTITKLLAEKLGFEHFSVGDFQREIAKEKRLTIKELGELEAKDSTIDKLVEERTRKLAKEKGKAVFDGWLAPYALPNSIKIFLKCDEQERAKRRLPQKRETEHYSKIEQAIEEMQWRVECNRERWLRYYNYDFLDMKNYDLIIDVTKLSPEEIVGQIMEFIENIK